MLFAMMLAAMLFGDGVHDDTAAIQERLDSGASVVELPAPKSEYLISKTLLIGDNQELRLGRFTRIRLAPGSNCSMLANRNAHGGNHHIALTGGVWDMNNRGQRHNVSALFWMEKAERRMWLNEAREKVQQATVRPKVYDENFFRGECMRLFNVQHLVVRGVTIRNPVTYGIQFWKVRDFIADDIEFDYAWGNPAKANMDGLHLDGWCERGKISNLRGICYDDMVALNATDGNDSPGAGPINDIDIDGVYCDYCHSAVRLLSRRPTDAIRRISIRNVHGRYYNYGIGLTYFHLDVKERGVMDAITISDCCMSRADEPADMWQLAPFGLVEIEKGIDIGAVTIERLVRDEHARAEVVTVRVKPGATVERLVLRDCAQINRTTEPMTFLHNAGTIKTLVNEGTRLVSAIGTNILCDAQTPVPQWASKWKTLAHVGANYPVRGAMLPQGKLQAGFGEGMLRVYPFVGAAENAKAARIDDYTAAGFPGYYAVEFPDEDIRAEVTLSATAAWFRIRYPEYTPRKLLVREGLHVSFSLPVVRTEKVGGDVVYHFAPSGELLVAKVAEGDLPDNGFDFDLIMSRARRAWNKEKK